VALHRDLEAADGEVIGGLCFLSGSKTLAKRGQGRSQTWLLPLRLLLINLRPEHYNTLEAFQPGQFSKTVVGTRLLASHVVEGGLNVDFDTAPGFLSS
jgi:hypothetical protein